MRWKRREAVEPPTAIITEGSELEGTSSFNGTVVLNGRAKGDLFATVALIVGETASIEAQLRAPLVVIDGQVVGKVAATERVELRSNAHVVGDVETPVLVINEGAVLDGRTKRPVREGEDAAVALVRSSA
jgi:cytoskeletal protein CcmA (bactofilin family)